MSTFVVTVVNTAVFSRVYDGGHQRGRCTTRLGGSTRRTGRTDRTGAQFLFGVDRSVQAPVGTVVKFSSLLKGGLGGRRGTERCLKGVGSSNGFLVAVVSRILRGTHVRDKATILGVRTRGLDRVFCSIGAMFRSTVRSGRVRCSVSAGVRRGCTIYSGAGLRRVCLGVIDGTVGCAPGNRTVRMGVARATSSSGGT